MHASRPSDSTANETYQMLAGAFSRLAFAHPRELRGLARVRLLKHWAWAEQNLHLGLRPTTFWCLPGKDLEPISRDGVTRLDAYLNYFAMV
jgi:hypothetical protein